MMIIMIIMRDTADDVGNMADGKSKKDFGFFQKVAHYSIYGRLERFLSGNKKYFRAFRLSSELLCILTSTNIQVSSRAPQKGPIRNLNYIVRKA